MKRTRVASLAAVAAIAALGLSACSGDGSGSGGSGGSGGDKKKVDIVQFVKHPSLDAANKGFQKGLKDNGIDAEIKEYNAQGEAANNAQIGSQVATSKSDLILAIATPSAQVLSQAVKNRPILFTAVTDPVDSKLVDSLEEPGKNVTGTSDANPVKEQLELLKQIDPDAKKIGIVYPSAEQNSKVQVDWAQDAASELGLTVETKAISASSEVSQAASSMNVDAFYVPTDNMVVASLESLLKVAENKKIPAIAAEGDSVKRGATATVGINYEKLGEQTGAMAAKVLKGEAKPEDMAVETQEEYDLYVNETSAKKSGIELPKELVEKAAEKY